MIISRSVLLRMRNVSDRSCTGNQNTHFVFNKVFFFENRAVCVIMWKNIVQRCGPQMTIWRMPIACCKAKVTHTHTHTHTHAHTHTHTYTHINTICSNLCFSTEKMVARKRSNITLYVQYSTVQYSTVEYSTYSTVHYSTVQYSTLPVLLNILETF